MDRLAPVWECNIQSSICAIAAAAIGAVATVGSGIASASIQGNAAQSAANTQANAATNAAQAQANEYAQTEGNLQPFIGGGVNALQDLTGLTGTYPGGNPLTAPLTAPFQPTQAQLAATPGYQFTLNQGLQATQNGFAAQGLGSSGAALKGAANYAEGLASTTYQQQFQNYLSQNQQIYNQISGIANQGENAAAGLGTLGQSNVNAQTALTTSGAAAQAAGTIGAANATTGAIGSLSSTANTGALLLGLQNSGIYGNSPNNSTNWGNLIQ